MNKPQPIFTVGYGTSSIEEFIDLLKHYQIKCIVDVRSSPYSKFNPDFSIGALKRHLEANGIAYQYMGDTLGGKPSDPSCYHPNGRPDYSKIKEKDFFKKGIQEVLSLWRSYQPQRIALMCACQSPERCHRSKLVGQYIYEIRDNDDISVVHIYMDKDGSYQEVDQHQVVLKIVQGQLNLFGYEYERSITLSSKKIKNNI
ncbi:DUF488 family protein [Rhodothermus marinus]|uniref:DUF488 domain-containing protein n=1 Tax=Rhodothermus marinus (strain ATCC 43812 / DSM 4252 / R-10) TaxID=518766 RepID=D0MKP7_RHOM4|nr:DUF488 domain-containing protein [Rhodothermus marinus]ACY49711.1 protein of unknown function DUF1130 [Rhodothermus marinus DSM 4252]